MGGRRARSKGVPRRLGVIATLCVVLAACGGTSAPPRPAAPSPVVRAPGDIAAVAQRAALATIDDVGLPSTARPLPGSIRVLAPPTVHDGWFGDDYAFVNDVEVEREWRVATTPDVVMRDVTAKLGSGATMLYGEATPTPALANWERKARTVGAAHLPPPPAASFLSSESWSLTPGSRWFANRDVLVSVRAERGGVTTVAVAARVAWIPERLRVPSGVRTAVLSLVPSGRVLSRVTNASTLRAIAALIDGLTPDEATRAVFSCPAMIAGRMPTELRIAFYGRARQTLATLQTEWCPPLDRLAVTGHGFLLLTPTAGFLGQLASVVRERIPVAAL